MKQFCHSSRNVHHHTGGWLLRDTFFPMEKQVSMREPRVPSYPGEDPDGYEIISKPLGTKAKTDDEGGPSASTQVSL